MANYKNKPLAAAAVGATRMATAAVRHTERGTTMAGVGVLGGRRRGHGSAGRGMAMAAVGCATTAVVGGGRGRLRRQWGAPGRRQWQWGKIGTATVVLGRAVRGKARAGLGWIGTATVAVGRGRDCEGRVR